MEANNCDKDYMYANTDNHILIFSLSLSHMHIHMHTDHGHYLYQLGNASCCKTQLKRVKWLKHHRYLGLICIMSKIGVHDPQDEGPRLLPSCGSAIFLAVSKVSMFPQKNKEHE